MRLKNAFKIPQQQAVGQPAGGGFGAPAIGGPNGESGSPGLDLNQLLNILPMSGRSDPAENSSTSTKMSPIRLLRFLKSTPEVGKASLPRLQPHPKLSGQYSDRLFTDEAITVGNGPGSLTTNVGKVRIDEIQQTDVPTVDDDFTKNQSR